MASAFTHGFFAVALGKIWLPRPKPWTFWFLVAASAVLPDGDVIGFALGIDYAGVFGHRGFFHSLLFAFLWSWFVVSAGFKRTPKLSKAWWILLLSFFAVTASHGVLDALTNGGLGVAFFSPFDTTRYFFPWRPIEVSPITITRFFSEGGGSVIQSELKYIWIPVSLLWVVVVTARRGQINANGKRRKDGEPGE